VVQRFSLVLERVEKGGDGECRHGDLRESKRRKEERVDKRMASE
jgi:hypothetical protein